MSVIIRLQNLPLTASSLDIRNFFHGLSIPDGGVHIVGGAEGDAFIAFSTDEDARQAMRLTGNPLKGAPVSLLLSSRNEMYKVIEQARVAAMGNQQSSSMSQSSSSNHNSSSSNLMPLSHGSSSSSGHSLLSHHHNSNSNNGASHPMSPPSSSSSTGGPNDYLRGLSVNSAPDLSSNPALLFSTMTAIPSATLGGANVGGFLVHGQTGFPGLPPTTQQQSSGLPYSGAPSVTNASSTSAPTFPNGNPFLLPPPSLSGVSFPFPGIMPSAAAGAAAHANSNNPLATAGGIGLTPSSTGVMGLPSNAMNSTMSMAGHHNSNPMNPFANPPPRMSLMSNGVGGMGNGVSGPRHNSNFGQGIPNSFGGVAGMGQSGMSQGGIGQGGMGQSGIGQGGMSQGGMNQSRMNASMIRGDFGNRAHSQSQLGGLGNHVTGLGGGNVNKESRFSPAGIGPAGRLDGMTNRDNSRDRRSRSRSRERRDALHGPNSRRRRSRSRDKTADRGGDRDRRRRRSRSRSNSRSRSRDRANSKISRRDSRDKRDERRRSDSSPEKSSQESERRSRREHEPSPIPNSTNTTTEEWPGAKLTGIPSDASYREIKEFIRVDVMGGSDGVVRLYDEGVAFLKLENPSEFPRVYRSNGRKLRGSLVNIEGITMEVWTQEYKLNKSRIERDIDREKEERERETRESRPPRDRGDRDRSDRHTHSSHHGSSSHHRSSRFSNASQSSCIAIRGLAPTITRQEVISRFLHDIPCQDVVLIAAPTPTNRHSVTAFISFESAQIAQTVIDTIARSPQGGTLVVETCDEEDLQRAKARTSGSGAASSGGRSDRDSRNNSTGITQDAKSIFELDLGLDDETTTVIMKGAPPNISERDVFDFFSDIGLAPMNVRIMYDTDGQCSGQVICEFPDNNKAKRATTKDGMLFGRGQISVSLLPSRTRIGNNGGGGGNFTPQQPSFIRGHRPGLLGPAPRGGGGGLSATPRFPMPGLDDMSVAPPIPQIPNIFEQALQLQSNGPIRPPLGSGGRARGGMNSSGERMSRFNPRSDFRGNSMGRGRGAGGMGHKDENHAISEDDMALFNKKGCVLGLENIPYKCSMDDILQYLEDNLKIRIAPDRIIRRYDEMQKPTGDARVAFDTEFEAKLACERLKETYLWKRKISAEVIE